MTAGAGADVVLVSLGSTAGLRRADDALAEALELCGATVLLARAAPPRPQRTLMLTDLSWALAARRALVRALAQLGGEPRAVIYSTTTAALLSNRPGAVRFDATSAGNRPGRHGLWQRPLERRRLRSAPLLLPWSAGALQELAPGERRPGATLVLPVPVTPSAAPVAERDITAITYAANPYKKGLDRVLAAWRELRAGGIEGELVVAGAGEQELRRAGFDPAAEPGVRVEGELSTAEYRTTVRRARVFVCAPRREDYGIAQLEALADGCQLVTTAAPGPYAALPIARELDSRLVGDDLAAGMRAALDSPSRDYARRALDALAPYRPENVAAVVAEQLLPRLLA